jgi:hypothetical protein
MPIAANSKIRQIDCQRVIVMSGFLQLLRQKIHPAAARLNPLLDQNSEKRNSVNVGLRGHDLSIPATLTAIFRTDPMSESKILLRLIIEVVKVKILRFLAEDLTSSVFSDMEELQRPVHAGVLKQGEPSRLLIQNHGTKITEK